MTKYPGYYKNNDGFLDDAIFIQDDRYYQAFSYVLKIDEKLESYKSAVKSLVHPAGLALFGEYDIRNEFDVSVSLESMIKILVVYAQDEVFMTDGYGTGLERTDPTFDVSKLLDASSVAHQLNDGTTNDTDNVTPIELVNTYAGGATRTGVDQYTLSKLLNSQSATPHYLNDGSTLDSDTLSATEGTSTYAGGSTRTGVDIFAIGKTLNSTVYTHYLNDGTTIDTDTFGLTENSTTYADSSTRTGAENFDIQKVLDSTSVYTHYLNDGTTPDSDTVLMSDTTGSDLTRTVPSFVWTKLLDAKSVTPYYLNDGTTLGDDTATITESTTTYVDATVRTGIDSIVTTKYMNSADANGVHKLYDNVTYDTDLLAAPVDSGGYIHLNTYVEYPDQYWTVTYAEGSTAFAGTN